MNITSELLNHIATCLVHTDLEITDALIILEQPVPTSIELQVIEQELLQGLLEHCPRCNHWIWTGPKFWNSFKEVCIQCSNEDD